MSPVPARAGEKISHLMLFAGRDIWGNGLFGYDGALWAPWGLDRSGFMIKALISAGLYRYTSGALGSINVYGGELTGQLLPGWCFRRGTFEAKLFAGPDLEYHRLLPDDPSNALRGRSLGLRAAIDIWYEPTLQTMIAADASYSTIVGDYTGRLAFGWRLLGLFYLGPEAQVYGGDGYRQYRFGVHITSFKTGKREWFAAFGGSIDTDQRASPYLRLGLLQRL